MADEANVVTETAPVAPAQAQPVESVTTTPNASDQVLSELSQLKAELQTLKQQQQSTVDSISQRLRNQMSKKFKAIDDLASDEGWDADDVRKRKERAAQVALMDLGATDLEAVARPSHAEQVLSPSVAASAEEARQGLKEYLADFGLSEQDLDISKYVRQVRDADEARALDKQFRADVANALQNKKANAAAAAKTLLREQDAAQVKDAVEQFDNIGGNSNAGAPETGRAANKANLRVDWDAVLSRKYPNKT